MASMKSPGRDVAALIKCIDDLKNEKNVKSRMTHYDSLTQLVVKSSLTDEAFEYLHSVAIPVTLEDVSQASESLVLSALGFLGGLLQVIRLPLDKQVLVVKALTAKLKSVEEKTQSRKLMWSLANIQFDETLPHGSLNDMLEAACLFLREKPPVFSLSTVCESLNALRNLGARHRAFTAGNIELIFSAVVPWLFNEADRIRELSIACLEPFTSEIAKKKVLDANFQAQLRSKYYGVLNQLVAAETGESLRIWSFLIQGFGTELHESVALLNELLKIEESALKSKNSAFRQCALERWKFIVDCFSLNPAVLNNSKRIKLVLVPLKSTDTRTANFSKTKIELWWYLLNKLGPNASQRFQEVTLPLLNFCFGSQADKTQVRGTALVFSNIVPLACAVLAGVLSPDERFECAVDDGSRLSRVHPFASGEDFGKSIDTFSQFSAIGLGLKSAIDPPEIYEAIVRGFVERCCSGRHHEALDTFVYTVMTMAVERPANMDVIFEAFAGTIESPRVVETLLKHAAGLVNWYAENEPLPAHPAARFLSRLFAAGVAWDLRKSSAAVLQLVEDVARVHGPITTSVHPVVEMWNKFAAILSANLESVKLSDADLRVIVLPQTWTALSLDDELLAPWFTLCSSWAKIDSSIIKLAVNHRHVDEEANVDDRSVRAVIRALKPEMNQHSLSLTLWLKQWASSWIKQAKSKENRAACTDSLVNLLLVVSQEIDKLEEVELLLKEVRDALQEQSSVKEVSDVLSSIFTGTTKSDSVLKLRKQSSIVKMFSGFSGKNTPARQKQKPKHLDDFVVVPPQEKTKRVLTEHQKEVLRSKRRSSNVPAMYNDLSQSSLQSDSQLDTQSNDGMGTVTVVSTCSSIEKDEEALLEPPCPIKSTVSDEKTSKIGSSLSIEEIVKSDMKLRSKVSVNVSKLDPVSTRRSSRLSSTESTNSNSSDSEKSPVINAFKRPGPASRKAQMAAQERAKAEERAEAKEKVEEHTDKENECTSAQSKSPFGSPARRVTLQPVVEQRIEPVECETVCNDPVETTKENSQPIEEETVEKQGEEPEKTVLNPVDMEVEAEETMATGETADVNASSMEITSESPKTVAQVSEEPINSVTTPMEITLCSERKETETVVNNLDALNETQTESQSQKAQTFLLKNPLLKTYAIKKKVPLKGPAPSSSKRGAQMLELSRKITRNEPPSKKLRKTDSSPGDEASGEVVVTPEGSPARTAKWIPRTYSPYASPSTGILKKRQQMNEEADDGCDSPISSASKARRVSFADPEVSHSVKISPAKKRLTRTRTRRSLISTYANNEAEPSKEELSTVMEASCNMSLSETCMAESDHQTAQSSETVVADTSMDVSCLEESEKNQSEPCGREENNRDSEPESHTTHSVKNLYPDLIDCEDGIECLYGLLGESDSSKLKDIALKMEVQTLRDLCNLPISCLTDQLDVDVIKKTIDDYLVKKSSPKKTAPVERTIAMDEDIELETSIPIVPSDDSKSSDEIKTPDSCPNGQIIQSESLELPATPVEKEQAIEMTPIETDESNATLSSSGPSSESPEEVVDASTSQGVKDFAALGSEEVITMIEQHPKKDEILLSLLRRHISFSFMLNGKVFPVQE